MKTTLLRNTLAAAGLVSVAALYAGSVSAQTAVASPTGVTRAQVRGELAELEAAGYRPGGEDLTYPNKLQAAQARVQAEHAGN